MKDQLERKAIELMIQYGGGFAHNLGKAWAHADSHNEQRLRSAFPDLLDRYKQMAQGEKKS